MTAISKTQFTYLTRTSRIKKQCYFRKEKFQLKKNKRININYSQLYRKANLKKKWKEFCHGAIKGQHSLI